MDTDITGTVIKESDIADVDVIYIVVTYKDTTSKLWRCNRFTYNIYKYNCTDKPIYI